MQLACLSTHFLAQGLSMDEFLRTCADAQVRAIELGVANRMASPGRSAEELLASPTSLRRLTSEVEAYGLRIQALNCFGNPLHPVSEAASKDILGIEATIRLANELGIRTVVTASGCPGDTLWPVWISWPLYWAELEPAQWSLAISTWSRLADLADAADVDLCIKLHPGRSFITRPHSSSSRRRAVRASGLISILPIASICRWIPSASWNIWAHRSGTCMRRMQFSTWTGSPSMASWTPLRWTGSIAHGVARPSGRAMILGGGANS